MSGFKAWLITKGDSGQKAEMTTLEDADLMPGDVTVRVQHSTVNYKDGLCITGRIPIARKFPMVPGIDLAGEVEASDSPNFKPGDKVLLNGYGLSEVHFGGYAEKARVKSEWLVKVPEGWSTAETMAVGTAGYTAMLCVLGIEKGGVAPGKGPILVTGAAGGVGSVAIALLSKLGYDVVASTGRREEAGYLKDLGAKEVMDRAELAGDHKPLDAERWAGVVDSVGSQPLANALSQTMYDGVVAACGLAAGPDLPATVMPFILRSVTLKGIDSVQAPMDRRVEAWSRLASDLDRGLLKSMTHEVALDGVAAAAENILKGQIRGRLVVNIG